MKSRVHWIYFILLASGLGAVTQERLELTHPQNREQVRLVGKTATLQADQVLACQLKAGSKGSVIARRGNQSLVVFNNKDWREGCGPRRGVGQLPMAWVNSDELKNTLDFDTSEYGDACRAYEHMEGIIEAPKTEAAVSICDSMTCLSSSLIHQALLPIASTSSAAAFACQFASTEKNKDMTCSFEAILNRATTCVNNQGHEAKCSPEECRRRLRELACTQSPWKEKELNERFQLTMEMAKRSAAPLRVDPRIVPCIAVVETGHLEPQAKTLLACQDAGRHRYHGLGMITLSTLENYISPYKKFRLPPGKGEKQGPEVKPFRSQLAEFQKPSFYACPRKLHDAMASSPELQVELMAYTLAEKSAVVDGNEYLTFANYNANSNLDPENGEPHFKNYADAVTSCVSCLRGAQAADNPVECLSAATRGGNAHPFYLRPGKRIYDVFAGYQKAGCGVQK